MNEPKVPANYFGKGKDHTLDQDNQDEAREFEKWWREWEEDHPDDPLGEKALAEYEATIKPPPELLSTINTRREEVGLPIVGESPEIKPFSSVESPDYTETIATTPTTKMRLELPLSSINKLRRFAACHRVRPRDVVATLIETHCNL